MIPINSQSFSHQQSDVISKTIITEKIFDLDSINYNYFNKYKLQQIQSKESINSNSSSNDDKSLLKIKNHPCIMNGNQIKKITEIQYGNMKYYIEDTYILTASSSQELPTLPSLVETKIQNVLQSPSSENSIQAKQYQKIISRKCCLFRKPKREERIANGKRNTKNVAKNFCKAFSRFLEQIVKKDSTGDKVPNCLKQFKKLTGHKKNYNNNIIWKIISSPVCKQLFRTFLQEHARQWILGSKISDKQVHLSAIQIYINLFEKLTFLEEDNQSQQQDGDEEGSTSK